MLFVSAQFARIFGGVDFHCCGDNSWTPDECKEEAERCAVCREPINTNSSEPARISPLEPTCRGCGIALAGELGFLPGAF